MGARGPQEHRCRQVWEPGGHKSPHVPGEYSSKVRFGGLRCTEPSGIPHRARTRLTAGGSPRGAWGGSYSGCICSSSPPSPQSSLKKPWWDLGVGVLMEDEAEVLGACHQVPPSVGGSRHKGAIGDSALLSKRRRKELQGEVRSWAPGSQDRALGRPTERNQPGEESDSRNPHQPGWQRGGSDSFRAGRCDLTVEL